MTTLATALRRLVEEAGGVEHLYKPDGYRHFGLTILDAMLSLRLHYSSTCRRLEHYCGLVDELDWAALGSPGVEHDAARLVATLEPLSAADLETVFGNLKAPGTRRPRCEVVLEVSNTLLAPESAVRTQAEFRQAVRDDHDRIASRIMRIHGVGIAGWRYLVNLNGLPAVKPDTMVVRWARRAIAEHELYRSEKTIGQLFESAVGLTGITELDIRTADHLVWRKESGRPISRPV